MAGISNCFLTKDNAPATPTHPGVDTESLCEAFKLIVNTHQLLRTHLTDAVRQAAHELAATKRRTTAHVSEWVGE